LRKLTEAWLLFQGMLLLLRIQVLVALHPLRQMFLMLRLAA